MDSTAGLDKGLGCPQRLQPGRRGRQERPRCRQGSEQGAGRAQVQQVHQVLRFLYLRQCCLRGVQRTAEAGYDDKGILPMQISLVMAQFTVPTRIVNSVE